jgi:hypothetical protein
MVRELLKHGKFLKSQTLVREVRYLTGRWFRRADTTLDHMFKPQHLAAASTLNLYLHF